MKKQVVVKKSINAQGALEYLLIIGAAILVVAVVIVALTGVLGTGKSNANTDSTDSAYTGLRDIIDLGKGKTIITLVLVPGENIIQLESLYGSRDVWALFGKLSNGTRIEFTAEETCVNGITDINATKNTNYIQYLTTLSANDCIVPENAIVKIYSPVEQQIEIPTNENQEPTILLDYDGVGIKITYNHNKSTYSWSNFVNSCSPTSCECYSPLSKIPCTLDGLSKLYCQSPIFIKSAPCADAYLQSKLFFIGSKKFFNQLNENSKSKFKIINGSIKFIGYDLGDTATDDSPGKKYVEDTVKNVFSGTIDFDGATMYIDNTKIDYLFEELKDANLLNIASIELKNQSLGFFIAKTCSGVNQITFMDDIIPIGVEKCK